MVSPEESKEIVDLHQAFLTADYADFCF